MLRRNGPVVKSVESVLRLEGSYYSLFSSVYLRLLVVYPYFTYFHCKSLIKGQVLISFNLIICHHTLAPMHNTLLRHTAGYL